MNQITTFIKLRDTLLWRKGLSKSIKVKHMNDHYVVSALIHLEKKIEDLEKYNLPMLQYGDYYLNQWVYLLRKELEHRDLI